MRLITFDTPSDRFQRMIYEIYMNLIHETEEMPFLSEIVARVDDKAIINLARDLISEINVEEASIIFDDAGESLLSANQEDMSKYLLRVSTDIISTAISKDINADEFVGLIADSLCECKLAFIVDIGRLDFKFKACLSYGDCMVYGPQITAFSIKEWGEVY